MSITLEAPPTTTIITLESASAPTATVEVLVPAPTKSTNTTHQALRWMIIDAHLMPNSHHLESVIAAELNVMPGDLLDPLHRLQQEGLVTSVGRGGFWIKPISVPEMFDVFGELGGLESHAAYLTAKTNPGAVEAHGLYQSIATMQAALALGDIDQIVLACQRFHRAFVHCCGDAATAAKAHSFCDEMHRARMLRLRLEPLPCDIVKCYTTVVDAIAAGDAETAFQVHQAHWQTAAENFAHLIVDHNMDSVIA